MPENHTNKNAQPPKKKRLTWWKIALGIFPLVIALFVLKIVLILTAKPTISVDYIAEWNRISKPPNYDPNQNASFDYQEAVDCYVDTQDKTLTKWGRQIWVGDMNDNQLTVLKEWLNANRQARTHLERGSAKPYYWAELPASGKSFWDVRSPIDLSTIRYLGTLENWQAQLHAISGQHTAAFGNIIADCRVASHFIASGITIEHLVGTGLKSTTIDNAFVILHSTTVDPMALQQFQQAIESQLSQDPNSPYLQGEKSLALDTIQRVFTDNGKGNGHYIPRQAATLLGRSLMSGIGFDPEVAFEEMYRRDYVEFAWRAITGPDRKQTTAKLEKLFAFYEKVAQQTPAQLRNQGIDPDKEAEEMCSGYRALPQAGSLYGISESYQRGKAQQGALLATIGILRYKADKGRLPESLQQLVSTGYLKELPMDIYSDGPLVYKQLDNNFTLYSLGADFDDDGGVRSGWSDWESGDQVFWPVERQNLQKE